MSFVSTLQSSSSAKLYKITLLLVLLRARHPLAPIWLLCLNCLQLQTRQWLFCCRNLLKRHGKDDERHRIFALSATGVPAPSRPRSEIWGDQRYQTAGPGQLIFQSKVVRPKVNLLLPASTCFYHVYVYITKFWISIVPNSTENFEHEKAFFVARRALTASGRHSGIRLNAAVNWLTCGSCNAQSTSCSSRCNRRSLPRMYPGSTGTNSHRWSQISLKDRHSPCLGPASNFKKLPWNQRDVHKM